MKINKVGILTTFSDLDSSYSLATVVKQQLISLVKYNYNPVLFVLTNFHDDKSVPEGVEVRKIVPQLIVEPYSSGDLSNFEEDTEKALEAFEENMKDVDVVLTHDIIFQRSFLPYNEAIRRGIGGQLSHIKWLHWIHSAPSIRPELDGSPYDNLYTLPENSKLVYMNYTDVVRAAEMYGVYPKDVRTVFNPMDIRELHNFHPVTKELIDAYDLMKPDIICVYPLSTTRMDDAGKQLSKVIITVSKLKEQGKTVSLIVPNAHANADREKEAIEKMYELAYKYGLERHELIFTSFHDAPKWELGVPHEVVRDLFVLGNLFIFPSVSENSPLVLLEAMAGKNILVLNKNFPAMRDFALENALYFEFGSLVETVTYHNGIENYLGDVAKIIISEYESNKPIKANVRLRQVFNIDKVFKSQLEPAMYSLYD